MYDHKDIILAVDYHAENTEVRWLNCCIGEEACRRAPYAVLSRAGIMAAR